MKRTFLKRRNALLSPAGFPWGALALGAVVLIALVRLVFPDTFMKAVTPVLRASTGFSVGVRSIADRFTTVAALSAENRRLLNENAQLEMENRTLVEKDKDLAALLGAEIPTQKGVIAGVIARPPSAPYDTLVLGGGQNEGIRVGQEAFGPAGTPVGMVTSLSDSFARVTLFSAPGQKFDAWAGELRTPVTVEGQGGGAFSAQAPRGAALEEGDFIFVSGPGALPIGKIAKLGGDASAPTLTVHIAGLVNPFTLTWVVLRDGPGIQFVATSTAP